MLLTAVPFFVVAATWRLPDTYHPAGSERGTATLKFYEVRDNLVEAADEKMLNKTIARYGRVDLLCLDELGYMELDRRGAELLFQVLTEREERSAIAIASNEPFSGWTKTFTDPRLCAAIVDRLTFAGQIIETGTISYRLAHARHARTTGASSNRHAGAKSG